MTRPLILFFTLLAGFAVGQVQLEHDVFDIARQLRCPVCRSESVADSSGATSIEMRNLIREQLQEGRSEAEILAFFQARYGDYILLEPPRRGIYLLVWGLPVVVGVFAMGLLGYYLRRWTQNANAPADTEDLDAADLERVRRALAVQDS